ncbi:hypothetical protein E4U54_005896, partial [Claviceps lovelessii]
MVFESPIAGPVCLRCFSIPLSDRVIAVAYAMICIGLIDVAPDDEGHITVWSVHDHVSARECNIGPTCEVKLTIRGWLVGIDAFLLVPPGNHPIQSSFWYAWEAFGHRRAMVASAAEVG